ncbi:hypothetical protein ANN_11854 [Periplaneta americana]|uniref:Uncharacterized protein n=1 Tax=Periplaneta americana TaxID=6978 RepID=A0ABQ8T8F8_PERAM|nr:hypothetical protein ANN_11854 [Periplaneta americana]
MENRHVTVDAIATNLNVSHVSAHHIIHDVSFKVQGGCHSSSLQNSNSDVLMPVKNFCGALKQNTCCEDM